MSFGRITPTEFPIRVSLRAAMGESDVITDVIIPPPPAGFKPPQTLISFRAHERLRARRRAARRSGQAEIHRVHDDHPQDREWHRRHLRRGRRPQRLLGHDDPPGAAAGFRAGGYPVNAISSSDDPKEDLDATTPTIYARRTGQSHRSHPRTDLGESDRRRIRGFRVPVVRPGLPRRENAAQANRGPDALSVAALPASG